MSEALRTVFGILLALFALADLTIGSRMFILKISELFFSCNKSDT